MKTAKSKALAQGCLDDSLELCNGDNGENAMLALTGPGAAVNVAVSRGFLLQTHNGPGPLCPLAAGQLFEGRPHADLR